ncbi:MAG: MBL fold metallo-hydrolase [Dehalococcoidia bacterium]|nr:MBL fold metallo-hydrolase [Dehalococcoidia bacterium]
MAEQVLPGLYRSEIPLPKSPLRAVNSYLIKGRERSLIIDTGMNREECMGPMLAALEELKVDLNKTDFFITHLHADHLGLVGNLATETSKVYFSEVEASVINPEGEKREERFAEMVTFYRSHGFPEDEIKKALQNHPGYRYSPRRKLEFTVMREGDTIDVGDYSFKCIETPGHSPGHMCLYEASKKILVSGDHILIDITPNITCWPELENALKEYLASLEKVHPLEVSLVLPGHRNIWNDHRGRIRELQEHHKSRLAETVAALEEGDKTAWEVAPYITWDIDVSSWELFPPVQKWFAIGETIAHLNYLEGDGTIRRKTEDGKVLFSLE